MIRFVSITAAGFALFGLLFVDSGRVFGTMLVQDYPLSVGEDSGRSKVDEGVSLWLDTYTDKPSVRTQSTGQVEKNLQSKDDLTKKYALALSHSGRVRSSKRARLLKDLQKSFETAVGAARDNPKAAHPLLPYVYQLISEKRFGDPSLEKFYRKYGQNSCPHKKQVSARLLNPDVLTADTRTIRSLLEQTKGFKKSAERNRMVRGVLELLKRDSKRRGLFVDQLAPLAEDTWFEGRYPWLHESSAIGSSGGDLAAIRGKLENVVKLARRGRCTGASKRFRRMMTAKPALTLAQADKTARTIAACARRSGPKARIESWKAMVPAFARSFGIEGKGTATLAVGRYQWTMDNSDAAISTLKELEKEARKQKSASVVAEAMILMGRIYEDVGETERAAKVFLEARSTVEDDDVQFRANSALVLIYAGNEDWKGLREAADRIISWQSNLDRDDRDSSKLGYALFWKGRSLLEEKKIDLAEVQFQRLTRELFSTYYGALGHYVLEQVSGTHWSLKSGPSVGFRKEEWFSAFSKTDQKRLARIESLLELGLREEAACEAVELDYAGDAAKELVASMMLYASGRFLHGIRIFARLPRSFRQTLPHGMEKILFPKKFEGSIREYAGRLGVDPDLVFALIRQESVFNPKARSPAGARGLMQLMPQTASIEARKVGTPYVSKKKREDLMSRTRKSSSLYDAQTNLLLGTHHLHRLMATLGSPVITLSAYNAGANAATRWQGQIETDDLLLFIEKIPYRETRNYVKLILRNYFYYSRWYSDLDKPLPHLKSVVDASLADVSLSGDNREKIAN